MVMASHMSSRQTNDTFPQCFICGDSQLESKDQPRPWYEEETALFKSLLMTPSFRKKVISPVYEYFSNNIETCWRCLITTKNVYIVHQKISTLKQELDELLERGRETMSSRRSFSVANLSIRAVDIPLIEIKDESSSDENDEFMEAIGPACILEEVELNSMADPEHRPMRQSELDKSNQMILDQDNHQDADAVTAGANLNQDHQFSCDEAEDLSMLHCYECGRAFSTILSLAKHEIEGCNVTCGPKNVEIASYPWERTKTTNPDLDRGGDSQSHTQDESRTLSDIQRNPPRPTTEIGDGINESESDGVNTQVELAKEEIPSSIKNPYHFPCSKCGKVFKRLDRKIHHEITVCKIHYDDEELKRLDFHLYKCDLCDEQFMTERNLRRHGLLHVGKIKANFDQEVIENPAGSGFSCPMCSKLYATRNDLFEHFALSHGSGLSPVVCGICGKLLSGHPGVLKAHIRRVHTKEPRFTCSYCQKGFDKGHQLTKHLKSGHKKEQASQNLQNKEGQGDKEDGRDAEMEQLSGAEGHSHDQPGSSSSSYALHQSS